MLLLFMEGENQGSEWPRSSQHLQPTNWKETLSGEEPPATISSLSSGRGHSGEASPPHCWQDCAASQPGGNRSVMPREGAVCRSGGSLAVVVTSSSSMASLSLERHRRAPRRSQLSYPQACTDLHSIKFFDSHALAFLPNRLRRGQL